MTTIAARALQQIQALRKHPVPQTPLAEKRILKTLSLEDLIVVTTALEQESQDSQGKVPRG